MCLFFHPATLCLSTGGFNPFIIRMIISRRKWQGIFKVQKGKNLQPRMLYSARLSFRIEGEIKNFSDKQKLKEYSNTKLILKEILTVPLQIEKMTQKERETIGKQIT